MDAKDLRIPTTPQDLIRAVVRGGGTDKPKAQKPKPKPESQEIRSE